MRPFAEPARLNVPVRRSDHDARHGLVSFEVERDFAPRHSVAIIRHMRFLGPAQ